jgi:hypothetical protein
MAKRTTYNSPREDYSGTSYPKMFSPTRDIGVMNQAPSISAALNLVSSQAYIQGSNLESLLKAKDLAIAQLQ